MVPSVMKGHVLHLFLLQRKAPGVLGGGLWCVALTSMSRRLLHRRYDMRGGEGNAALHRCEERRMLRLLKMMRRMLGRAGLNETSMKNQSYRIPFVVTFNPALPNIRRIIFNNLNILRSSQRCKAALLGIFGRGVPPGSPNPDPISDQNIPFSTPVFRPGI